MIKEITQDFLNKVIEERKLLRKTLTMYNFRNCFIHNVDFGNLNSRFYFKNCLIKDCSFDQSSTSLVFYNCTLDFVTFDDCESLFIDAESTQFYDCSIETEEQKCRAFYEKGCTFINFYTDNEKIKKEVIESNSIEELNKMLDENIFLKDIFL